MSPGRDAITITRESPDMSDRLFVATRKGLFTVERENGTWRIARTAFLGDAVTLVLPRADGRVLAALELGHFGVKVHRSTDGGETWNECAAPEFPPKPEGLDETDGMGKPWQWKVSKVWALAPADPARPRALWCGTLGGGLFSSEDDGDSWTINRELWDQPGRVRWFGGGAEEPGIHSICVDPRDTRRVLVGVSCGGAWLTEDGGKSWACRADGMRAEYMPPEHASDPGIQDAHYVVQCPGQPEKLWAQHHNGIFRSTDGAKSWHAVENVPPSSFGFATAVHPEDGDTAWFVPGVKDECRVPVDGAVVVTRTRDGGKTFDVLREGLPQSHAYDITLRHALDLDATGRRLAFGSTTGSLWISEDQGDSFATVSNHLPPVYCVRWERA